MKAPASDLFYRKAKQEGFWARSVYKLAEIDQKYRILRPGDRVLDLGAAPGSWTQYAAERIQHQGCIVSIDREILRGLPSPNVCFLQRDLRELEGRILRETYGPFAVVLSDAAPKTSGNRSRDHRGSAEICFRVLRLAEEVLKVGGHLVCKMYQGEETQSFFSAVQEKFEWAKIVRPRASRTESREIFLVGLRRNENPETGQERL